MHVTRLAEDVHELETLLDDPPPENPDDSCVRKWEFIKDKWKFEITDIDQVLGIDRMRARLLISSDAYKRAFSRAEVQKNTQSLVALMELRCFPLREVFGHYEEYLNKLCERRGNKRVRFLYQHDSHELSHEEAQRLDGALIHIFRNCLDHGVEDSETRKTQGKDPIATLHIGAFRTAASNLHLVIKDDGRGVDGDRLGRKAVERKLWSETQFERATHQEKVELMFAAGLSTAAVRMSLKPATGPAEKSSTSISAPEVTTSLSTKWLSRCRLPTRSRFAS